MSDSEDESGMGHETEGRETTAPSIPTGEGIEVQTTSSCIASKNFPKSRKAQYKKTKTSNEKKSAKPTVKYECSLCDFETTNLVKHFAHKRQHRQMMNGKSYKCHLCNYACKVKGGLQRHVKRVHTKERPFTCPVCSFRTVDKPSMANHIIGKHTEDFGSDVSMYVNCIRSNLVQVDEGNSVELNDIEPNEAPNEKSLIETEDGPLPTLMNEGGIDQGKPSNNDSGIALDKTGCKSECYVIKSELDPNESELTGQQKQLSSSVSTKKRTAYSVMNRRLYSTPEYREMRARKLTCEFCQKQCSSQRSLLSHFNEHKNENVFCPICHMFIVDSECRNAHIDNHLDLENRYLCATCLSTFPEESQVIAHQQRDHRKSINVVMECMFCPFSSRSQERFSRHMTRCHMFASDVHKHNVFDVFKMKIMLSGLKIDQTKNQVKAGLLDASTSDESTQFTDKTVVEKSYEIPKMKEEAFAIGDDENSDKDADDDDLGSSFLDISANLEESLDDLEKLLDESQILDLDPIQNYHTTGEMLKKKENHAQCNKRSDLSSPSDGIPYESRSIADGKNSLCEVFSTTVLDLKLESATKSSSLSLTGQMRDLPISEFNVPLEMLKESAAMATRSPSVNDSIHRSKSSSVANNMCNKTEFTPSNNLQMKQKKTLKRSKIKRAQSPDSTSGGN